MKKEHFIASAIVYLAFSVLFGIVNFIGWFTFIFIVLWCYPGIATIIRMESTKPERPFFEEKKWTNVFLILISLVFSPMIFLTMHRRIDETDEHALDNHLETLFPFLSGKKLQSPVAIKFQSIIVEDEKEK